MKDIIDKLNEIQKQVVIRQGHKVKIPVPKEGYRVVDDKYVKMSSGEIRQRSISQKRAAKKKRSGQAQANKQRARSMAKRHEGMEHEGTIINGYITTLCLNKDDIQIKKNIIDWFSDTFSNFKVIGTNRNNSTEFRIKINLEDDIDNLKSIIDIAYHSGGDISENILELIIPLKILNKNVSQSIVDCNPVIHIDNFSKLVDMVDDIILNEGWKYSSEFQSKLDVPISRIDDQVLAADNLAQHLNMNAESIYNWANQYNVNLIKNAHIFVNNWRDFQGAVISKKAYKGKLIESWQYDSTECETCPEYAGCNQELAEGCKKKQENEVKGIMIDEKLKSQSINKLKENKSFIKILKEAAEYVEPSVRDQIDSIISTLKDENFYNASTRQKFVNHLHNLIVLEDDSAETRQSVRKFFKYVSDAITAYEIDIADDSDIVNAETEKIIEQEMAEKSNAKRMQNMRMKSENKKPTNPKQILEQALSTAHRYLKANSKKESRFSKIEDSELVNKLMKEFNLSLADFSSHESDLYVRTVPGLMDWLKRNYESYRNITTFRDSTDRQMWIDIPFALI